LAVTSLLAFTAAQASASSEAAKISEVEQGLRPAAALYGKPVPLRGLREEMTAMHIPGVSIAVIHQGRIVWAKGYGVTQDGGTAITPETLFQAGSISKSLTAVAAMQLVQAGKVELDENINDQLTSWHFPSNALTTKHVVTLRQLLSHTGGVNVHGFNGYAAGAPVPTLLQVLDGKPPANSAPIRVVAEPGMLWSYSGGGYTVVQQLIIDVTHAPFETWLQQHILDAADMRHSTFDQVLPPALAQDVAMPHDENGASIPGGPHRYPELGAAGLWTTPSDLARFLIQIQAALGGKRGQLLEPAMVWELLKPIKPGHSMGFDLDGSGKDRYFDKGGDTAGFAGQMIAFNYRGDGVVILTNGARGNDLGNDIARSVAAAYHWPALQTHVRNAIRMDEAKWSNLAGTYVYDGGGSFSLHIDNDHLSIKQATGSRERMYPQNAGTWFTLSDDATYVFSDSRGASGYMEVEGERIPFHRPPQSLRPKSP